MKNPMCNNSRRNHVGIFWNVKKACYEYGSLDHLVRDYLLRTGSHSDRTTLACRKSQSKMRIRTTERSNSVQGTSSRKYAKTYLKISPNDGEMRT